MPGGKAPEEQRKEQILRAALAVATRQRLEGLSTRAVTSEAGLSHGMVFFHFRTKDALLIALLESLLDEIAVPRLDEDLQEIASPSERLLELLRREIGRLRAFEGRALLRLLGDGTRHPAIRKRMRAALERYRELLRGLAEEVVREAPASLAAVSADGLAAVVVGFIEGCAVQAVIDPDRFDIEEFMTTARALLAQLGAAERRERPKAG